MKHTSNFCLGLVSYNSPQTIDYVCKDLQAKGVVFHWFYVHHKAYVDPLTSASEKEHFHLELLCAKGFDGDDIAKQFDEYDPQNPDKPLGCVNLNDKERHIPLALQLEHALLYDLHNRLYIELNNFGDKPYYDINYKSVVTDCQEWLDTIRAQSKKDMFLKLIKKPSAETVTTCIFEHLPVCDGDIPLTPKIALHRHWCNSWEFRNLCGMMKDKRTEEYYEQLYDEFNEREKQRNETR